MDLELFARSPIGSLVPISGHDTQLRRDYRYQAFVPHPLPSVVPLSSATYKRAMEAERALGRLDGATGLLPNPDLLIRPTLFREAQSTSALEGTYAPLREVIEADIVADQDQSAEVREIRNYVRAAEHALDLLRERPICLTVVAELQALLVHGTRGGYADAGRLRTGQVYIGERAKGIESSRFVPPPAGEPLINGVSAWEKWINADDETPLLVKAALGHYQFETLHPFSDGNGRLGRLIIVLQLVEGGALARPILNLSPYFEARRDTYMDLLLHTSASGDFEPWVRFFADAVMVQAVDTTTRITRLADFRQHMLDVLRDERARGVVADVARGLIDSPVVTIPGLASRHGVTYPPAKKAVDRLVALGFLEEITGGHYGKLYYCPEVLRILESVQG